MKVTEPMERDGQTKKNLHKNQLNNTDNKEVKLLVKEELLNQDHKLAMTDQRVNQTTTSLVHLKYHKENNQSKTQQFHQCHTLRLNSWNNSEPSLLAEEQEVSLVFKDNSR